MQTDAVSHLVVWLRCVLGIRVLLGRARLDRLWEVWVRRKAAALRTRVHWRCGRVWIPAASHTMASIVSIIYMKLKVQDKELSLPPCDTPSWCGFLCHLKSYMEQQFLSGAQQGVRILLRVQLILSLVE